jgi:hypothetical protein
LCADNSENLELLLRLGHKKSTRVIAAVVHVHRSDEHTVYTLTEWSQLGRFPLDADSMRCEGCFAELGVDDETVRLAAFQVWRHLHSEQGYNRLIDTRQGSDVKILFAQTQNLITGTNLHMILEGNYAGKVVQVDAIVHQNLKLKLQLGPLKMKNMLPRHPDPEPEEGDNAVTEAGNSNEKKDEL